MKKYFFLLLGLSFLLNSCKNEPTYYIDNYVGDYEGVGTYHFWNYNHNPPIAVNENWKVYAYATPGRNDSLISLLVVYNDTSIKSYPNLQLNANGEYQNGNAVGGNHFNGLTVKFQNGSLSFKERRIWPFGGSETEFVIPKK